MAVRRRVVGSSEAEFLLGLCGWGVGVGFGEGGAFVAWRRRGVSMLGSVWVCGWIAAVEEYGE